MTSVHFITQGCSANVADSEYMQGLLQQAQFTISKNLDEADIIVMNGCTVKGPTESKFFKQLEEIKQEHPYKVIVLAGCIAQTNPKLKEYCLIGTKQIHNVVAVVEEALNDNVIHALETGEMPPLNLPKVRKNPVVEIIPINRGCLSACTFCKTKEARGNLQSYPVQEIVTLASNAVQQGVKEIWLTSQDTFCYGFDLGTNLAFLVEHLIQIPGKFKIRIGMGNPVHLKNIKDQLFPLLKQEKVFKFLHIPAQSGSNKVLKDMRRGNTNEEFLSFVQEIKSMIPNVTLATDIIVGYPTETDDDHWQTLETMKKTSIPVMNISRFWPRPGTPAAKLKQLAGDVVKHRSKIITDIHQNISRLDNEKWVGWEGEVLVDEQGDGQWLARNDAYKQIILQGDFQLGQWVRVKVTKALTYGLIGEVI
jgi:threonylcarbamoyladenosine tRNA methylthiotransferase CDKAL1